LSIVNGVRDGRECSGGKSDVNDDKERNEKRKKKKKGRKRERMLTRPECDFFMSLLQLKQSAK